MIEHVPVVGLAIALGGLSGFLIGLIYLRQLRRSLQNFGHHASGWKLVLGALARVLVAVGVFVLLMQWSSVAALSGLVGFSLARILCVTKEELI